MWLRFAFTASVLTPFLHIAVLFVSGQDAVATPIIELSRHRWGPLHTLELVLFGAAHLALAIGLGRLDRGRLWPYGRYLLVASSLVLVYIAYFFAASEEGAGPEANGPLCIGDGLGVLVCDHHLAGTVRRGLADRAFLVDRRLRTARRFRLCHLDGGTDVRANAAGTDDGTTLSCVRVRSP